jgi:hypothetical protein
MNYYNNDYIGATGVYGITDYVDTTVSIASNILNLKIDYTSNILDTKIDYTSNILNTKIDYTSNILDTKYSKLINEKITDNIINTYIYSSNTLGEIRFVTKGTPIHALNNNNNYIIKIKENGRLAIYYNFDFAFPTVLGGWYDIMDGVRDAYAYQATNGIITGDILIAINNINSQLLGIESALGTLATNVELLNGTTVEGLEAIITDAVAGGYGDIFNNTAILGISGFTVVGLVSTITGGIMYEQYITAQLKELLQLNNSNVTQTQKDGFIQQLKTAAIDNLYRINSNLRNLNTENGFVNSNISSTQFINNLKVNTLDVNNGNITNINGISVNEIIAQGKIKQNGILLDNTYLTSNHLYNLSYNYTIEREYPSKLYTTSSVEDTVSLLGKSVYHQILYLDNTITAYGNGFYEIYSSSSYDNGVTNKDKLFNYDTTETSTAPRWGISLYQSGTGNYIGNNSIDNSYYGDWVIIKMPKPIILTRYRIYQRSDFPFKAPAEWKVYGSNDGISFSEIIEASQMTRLSLYSVYYEKTLVGTFSTQYQYIGFVFNKLISVSGNTDLSFSEIKIFGKEIIGNNIVSNIYATSNAVKNIVQYDMPIIAKHYGFYISIATPIVIGTTTFYKYDINLTPYCSKGIIQIGPQSGDTFRSFKIRVMLATMYFSYIINDLPNVCFYEVFMSYKNTAAPPNGVAGLNACAIGYPHNPTLQTIMPNNLFVIKNGQGSIDYITVVATTLADVRVIIEDLIG